MMLAMVFIVLKEFGIDRLEAIATVAIVETVAKMVRASKSKTFMFNFSPPFFLFFIQVSDIWCWKHKNYMELSSRSIFGGRFGVRAFDADERTGREEFSGYAYLDRVET